MLSMQCGCVSIMYLSALPHCGITHVQDCQRLSWAVPFLTRVRIRMARAGGHGWDLVWVIAGWGPWLGLGLGLELDGGHG